MKHKASCHSEMKEDADLIREHKIHVFPSPTGGLHGTPNQRISQTLGRTGDHLVVDESRARPTSLLYDDAVGDLAFNTHPLHLRSHPFNLRKLWHGADE